MEETPKKAEGERLRHFDEIVDWCQSNGFTDFDFEGLEQRVLELAKTLQSPDEEADPVSESNGTTEPSSNLIFFKRGPTRRDS